MAGARKWPRSAQVLTERVATSLAIGAENRHAWGVRFVYVWPCHRHGGVSVKLRLLAVPVALLAVASCAGTEAAEPNWDQLPAGGQAYVVDGMARNDCSPLVDAVGFTTLMEGSASEKSALYTYLQQEAAKRDCTASSTDELLAEVSKVPAKDVEQLMSTPDDENPLYHGPGCMGAVQSLNDYMQLQTVADDIQMLGVLALTVTGMLNSIPEAVSKDQTQEPSKTDNATVNVVSGLLNDREAFTRPKDGQELTQEQTMAKMLMSQLVELCVRDYQEAANPSEEAE